jgi:hypothetical protein
MSTNRFLTWIGNGIELVQAIAASAGASDANKIISTDATGKIGVSLLPNGLEIQAISATASEALADGDLVNFWMDSTVRKMRKADASNGRAAHGFIEGAGVASGAVGEVYRSGRNSSQTGFDAGAVLYLSATQPGKATATPPALTDPFLIQTVGYGDVSGDLIFEFDQPITINLVP